MLALIVAKTFSFVMIMAGKCVKFVLDSIQWNANMPGSRLDCLSF